VAGSAAVLIVGVLLGALITNTNHRSNTTMHRIRTTLFGTRRRKIASVVAALALVGAGSALAAWLINATGTGAGSVASLTAPTVATGTSTGPGCLPGGTCDAAVKITNPNNVPLQITGIADGGSSTLFSGSCTGSNLTVNDQPTVATPITVPANATATTITLKDAYKLAAATPTTCQGQTFTKGVALTFST
jgi:hypothetical protein